MPGVTGAGLNEELPSWGGGFLDSSDASFAELDSLLNSATSVADAGGGSSEPSLSGKTLSEINEHPLSKRDGKIKTKKINR